MEYKYFRIGTFFHPLNTISNIYHFFIYKILLLYMLKAQLHHSFVSMARMFSALFTKKKTETNTLLFLQH